MYELLRSILFLVPAEKAHYLTMGLFEWSLKIPLIGTYLKKTFNPEFADSSVDILGLHFPNRVGLAAGFDKDAKFIHTLPHLGFGFIEIGTVTPKGQAGNPQPRLFRLKKDQALINRLGFNNEGAQKTVERLKERPENIIIGGNIGKNKITPNDNAVEDYKAAFQNLYPYVDYFTVNVSSPNTPGLRALQDKEPLLNILHSLKTINSKQSREKPILLKIAPDLNDNQLDDIIAIVKESGIDGVIATNTTIDRSNLETGENELNAIGNGGLSGAPLKKRSTEVIRYLHQKSNASFPIIAVGGIMNGKDAVEKIEAGASLIQVYTGLVYNGPGFVKSLRKALSEMKH